MRLQKAPERWRTQNSSRGSQVIVLRASVLDCGSPLPLCPMVRILSRLHFSPGQRTEVIPLTNVDATRKGRFLSRPFSFGLPDRQDFLCKTVADSAWNY